VGGLAVAVVTALVFARSVGHGFVAWDDETLLGSNPGFRGFGWTELRWMAGSTLLGHYVPVTWLSFALDHLVWGLDPRGYHLTNVLLHAANGALVCGGAARLLARATAWPGALRRLVAVAVALLWALHPLRVEAVSWVTGRRDVLSGFFFLLALTAYLTAASADGARRRRWLAASVAAYGLALGSKAVVMTAPLALVALDVQPLRRLPGDARGWGARALRGVWLEKIPLAVLAGLAAVGSAIAVPRGAGYQLLGPADWLGKLSACLATPLWKTVWPFALSPLYELPRRIHLGGPEYWGGGLLVAGVSLAALVLRRRWPVGVAAWIWYLAFLAPVSAIAHAGPQITADRYSYLPILGPLMLAGTAAGAAVQAARSGRLPGALPRGLGIAVVLLLIGLAGLTWRQQGAWRDTGRLWAHAVAATPDCVRCRVSLANWLLDHGRPEEAIAHYQRALRLDPARTELHANVGLALVRLGRPADAISHYEAVLARTPDRIGARVSLVSALVATGRLSEAVARLDEAGEFTSPGALVEYFRQLTTAQPAAAVPRLGLLQAYVRVGHDAPAREAYDALASLHPALASRARLPGAPDPPRP
jgi:hypothetical protein